jgi:MarR family transcriptional regulator for hemolysin
MSTWAVRSAERGGRPGGTEAVTPPAASEFLIEESLGYLLNRAARLLAHQLADRLRPHGVGIGQWAVLMFLWARDGITQAELSRLVAIEPPTMVRTIDRLERDGLVTRTPDPMDGRASRIRLTDRGWSLRDPLVPEAVAVNRVATERLTEAETRTLRRLLGKLTAVNGAS